MAGESLLYKKLNIFRKVIVSYNAMQLIIESLVY